MYVPPTLRFMVLEALFCLQKLRLQQSLYGVAAAFFYFSFPDRLSPWLLRIGNVRLPTGRFQTFSGSRCLKAHRLPEANLILLP